MKKPICLSDRGRFGVLLRWTIFALLAVISWSPVGHSAEPAPRTMKIWPSLAPGETTDLPGTPLPKRAGEEPPATRVGEITQPTLEVFEPAEPPRAKTAVLICPGGGYNYVVTDKEGSEAAQWLNSLGATAYVLRYRTKTKDAKEHWRRPLQDAQRAMSLLRGGSVEPKFERVGILGFSAGGQLAALVATRSAEREYPPVDKVDEQSCRPDFAMLIYPWQLYEPATGKLIPQLTVTATTPPTFLVHTDDDSSTSLGSAFFYAALKQQKVPAELHIFRNGGHGYGLRPVAGSRVHTWPVSAAAWLEQQGN